MVWANGPNQTKKWGDRHKRGEACFSNKLERSEDDEENTKGPKLSSKGLPENGDNNGP